MGQYYKVALLAASNKKTIVKWFYSHSYGNGLKLMEHSWLGNKFVGAVESVLLKNPQIVVWAGDYAEPCNKGGANVYTRCKDDETRVSPKDVLPQSVRASFIVNHTTKEFIDKRKVPSIKGWRIHPLSLMTCEGNKSGGGDFYGDDPNKLVGSWARNLISIERKQPEGYKEVFFNLVER